MSNLTATSVDVAVIGAGFAGLQAALDVQKAGLSYALIEANDRVGGKTLTTDLGSIDGVVELGPTWINNVTQPRITSLVEGYNLTTAVQYLEGLGVFFSSNGTAIAAPAGSIPESATEEELAKLEAILTLTELEGQKFDTERPGQWVNGSAPLLPDTSLGKFMEEKGIEQGSFAYTFLTASHRTIFGLDPSEVGMHYLLDLLKQCHGWQSLTGDHAEGAQYLWVPEGIRAVAEHMANDLRHGTVSLGDPVTHIFQANSSTTVRTKSGRNITAKKVILTAASHTYTHINFTPALPRSKRELAINTLRGRTIKTLITYRSPWWRELGLLGKFTSAGKGPITTTWELSYNNTGLYALAIFSAGADYDTFVNGTTALERQAAMLDDLAGIFGTAVGQSKKDVVYNVVEYLERDWYEEPYIESSPIASIGPGDFARLAPALRDVVGHVHFSGTETASVWKGYLEGAVDSGNRAAKEVIELLGRN